LADADPLGLLLANAIESDERVFITQQTINLNNLEETLEWCGTFPGAIWTFFQHQCSDHSDFPQQATPLRVRWVVPTITWF
jgi:hypothetical protein